MTIFKYSFDHLIFGMAIGAALLGLTAAARAERVVEPYAAIVGGLQVETLQTRPGDDRQDRAVTIALSRFGVRGRLGHGVTFESEFEANAGPHGTSAWEGQAALSVRNQLVRLDRGRVRLEAGRITDPASLDFTSLHVLDQLLTDGFTRAPLLASGFNRGNGVLARFELAPGWFAGATLNAANPTSTTSSLVVGGTFPPFSRFYFAPYQYVGRDAANFPADEYHIVVFTPSLLLRRGPVEAQAALQLFHVDTNTSSMTDQGIDGYNVRLGAAATFGRVRAFANVSLVQNEVVDPDDGARLSGEIFTGATASAGVDIAYLERHGVGGQIAFVRDQQGAGTRATQFFANIGTTFWLAETTAVAARIALFTRCEEIDGGMCEPEGSRSFFVTLRTSL